MHPVADQLRQHARRLIVFPMPGTTQRVVYQVKRVRTEELMRAGFLEMVGARVLQAAEQEADHAHEIDRALDHVPSDATEDDVREARADAENQIRERQLTTILGGMEDEGGRREYIAQLEAYLMACVEAAGMARDDGEAPIALGMQPRGTQPAQICTVIRDDPGEAPVYLMPLRFVDGDHVSDAHHVPVSELSLEERFQLGLLVMAAVLDTREVRPFRHEPGDVR